MFIYFEYSLISEGVGVENGVILAVVYRCAYLSTGRYKRLVDIWPRNVYDGNTSMYLFRLICLYVDGCDVKAIDFEDLLG